MVICLERDADLHMAQLMPLPLTVSCFSKIQIGFTSLVPAHPGSPEKRTVKCVCVCVRACVRVCTDFEWCSRQRTTRWWQTDLSDNMMEMQMEIFSPQSAGR